MRPFEVRDADQPVKPLTAGPLPARRAQSMKNLILLTLASLVLACTPRESECVGVDAGTSSTVIDAGPPTNEVSFRLVNLSRETVNLFIDGQDGGEPVLPLGTLTKTGHVTLIKQRGSIDARTRDADGGLAALTLPFEFDPRTEDNVTLVVRDTTPSRISMNVTVAKQTPNASFGERVRAALAEVDLPGAVDVDGDCAPEVAMNGAVLASISLREDNTLSCDGTADAYFARPLEVSVDATPYFIQGRDRQLEVAWVSPVKEGASTAVGQAKWLGASISGSGVVTSGPTRKVYVINTHNTQKPGSIDVNGILLAQDVPAGTMVRVKTNLVAASAHVQRPEPIARIIIDGFTQTFPVGVLTGPCKPPYLCDWLNGEDTLLVMSETGPNSASMLKADATVYAMGVRRPIVFATTSVALNRACVGVLPNDDICIMGSAFVSSVGSLAGNGAGASQASYAATGRMLYPPKSVPGGTAMQFIVEEIGSISRRFIWDNPAGLTPTADRIAGGFAIVAGNIDPRFPDRRALYFVDTTVNPWVLSTSISR